MREILFRGKCVDSGEWVEGWLMNERIIPKGQEFTVECRNPQYFVDTDKLELYEITPSTIEQYTGLTDKNGTKIFEGDICWFYGGDYYSGLWEQNAIVAITDMTDDEQTHYLNNAEYCEVIGNIYDNPELLTE